MGDEFTIADVSLLGWVRNLVGFYGARDLVEFDALERVPAWLERALARPAVQRGLDIPKRQLTRGAQRRLRYWMKPERSARLIVKAPRRGVALLGQPMDARAALAPRRLTDVLDQRAADAGAARRGRDEQVLEVAIIAGGPARAVADAVDEADGVGAVPGEGSRSSARRGRSAAGTSDR